MDKNLIFDSHAHYNDSRFGEDAERSSLLDEMFSQAVGVIVNSSVSPDDTRASIKLAEKYPRIFANAGIHPEDCERVGDIDSALADIEALSSHPKVVAIGEIGLDYYHEPFDKNFQQEVFRKQLELARKLKMPVVIHDRDAHGDVDAILKEYRDVTAVLHSYSGSAEWARELVRDGRYISFSGVLTFKNARKTVEVAEVTPLDRILLETDAPYLAPTPLRGTTNNSQNIIYTAARLAEIKSTTTENILKITFENACRFYNIDESTLAKL